MSKLQHFATLGNYKFQLLQGIILAYKLGAILNGLLKSGIIIAGREFEYSYVSSPTKNIKINNQCSKRL